MDAWKDCVQQKALRRKFLLGSQVSPTKTVTAPENDENTSDGKNTMLYNLYLIVPKDDSDEGYWSVAESEISDFEENTSTFLNILSDVEQGSTSESETTESSEDDNPYKRTYLRKRNILTPIQGRSLSAQFAHITR